MYSYVIAIDSMYTNHAVSSAILLEGLSNKVV